MSSDNLGARQIQEILFGTDPDNFTIGYRTAQVISLLHGDVELEPYFQLLDQRYSTEEAGYWFYYPFGPTYSVVTGNARLEFSGRYQGVTETGQHQLSYLVDLDAGPNNITVRNTTTGTSVTQAATSIPTDWVELPDSGMSIRVESSDGLVLPASWTILLTAQPDDFSNAVRKLGDSGGLMLYFQSKIPEDLLNKFDVSNNNFFKAKCLLLAFMIASDAE